MENREYTKCYIAFLDMLGFKSLISQGSCEKICEIFDNVKKPVSAAYFKGEAIIPQETAHELKIKIMSDSICFYIDVNRPSALFALVMSCLIFQSNLFCLTTPILLRGAIVCGDMYAKDDVTFGPGLTQAYLLEEYNARYPRIILTNEVLDYARQEISMFPNSLIDDWIFRDFDAFYALNCVKIFLTLKKSKDEDVCKNFCLGIEKVLDTTTDKSIREKYVYLERVLKEHGRIKEEP